MSTKMVSQSNWSDHQPNEKITHSQADDKCVTNLKKECILDNSKKVLKHSIIIYILLNIATM